MKIEILFYIGAFLTLILLYASFSPTVKHLYKNHKQKRKENTKRKKSLEFRKKISLALEYTEQLRAVYTYYITHNDTITAERFKSHLDLLESSMPILKEALEIGLFDLSQEQKDLIELTINLIQSSYELYTKNEKELGL